MTKPTSSEVLQLESPRPVQQTEKLVKTGIDDEMANMPSDGEPESTNNGSNHLSGIKLYLVAFSLSCGYFLILLNSTIVVTVPPLISGKLPSED